MERKKPVAQDTGDSKIGCSSNLFVLAETAVDPAFLCLISKNIDIQLHSLFVDLVRLGLFDVD